MMIETKLQARLKTIAPNVYPLAAPKSYLRPAVVWNRVSTDPTRDIGDDLEDTMFVTFQIDVYSTLYDEAKALSDTIRASLKGWIDPDIQSVSWSDERAGVDQTTDVQLFRVMVFYTVFCTS